jgi:hypothetical protein
MASAAGLVMNLGSEIYESSPAPMVVHINDGSGVD